MRIGFCIRKNFAEQLGGDGIQMLKTKQYLEEIYHHEICVITDFTRLDDSYDIIHIFNYLTTKETKEFFSKAIELNLCIVSSSIYWDYKFSSTHVFSKLFHIPNFLNTNRINFQVNILKLITKFTNIPIGISPKFKKACKYFFENSRFVLPNSIEEGEKLLEFIQSSQNNKIRVVFNATDFDSEIKNTEDYVEKNTFLKKYKIPDNYILQVGRIEYLKNQLNLISAFKNSPNIPIVFVGKVIENRYYKKLLKIVKKRKNVYFISNVNHEEIKNFYRFARVHVLLSLRESPGLVSLEALSLGCPVVVSDDRFAPVKTYFNSNNCYIVNPLDLEDILKKTMTAYTSNKIFHENKFTWRKTAEQTNSVYLECKKNEL